MRARIFIAAAVIIWTTVGSVAVAQRHRHGGHRHGGHHHHHLGGIRGLHLHGGLSGHYHFGRGLFGLGHALSHVFSSPYYYRSYRYYDTYPYGIYYRPYGYNLEYYLPPIYAPAELNYGPLALDRFLGVNRNPILAPIRPIEPKPTEVAKPDVSVSNLTSRLRAARFRDQGDELFGDQRYASALERYKLASKTAPDLAEPYFRQGHAYIAMQRYDQAVAAFKRGLALDETWAQSDFLLDSIYGDGVVVKNSHLESLARDALADAYNGDLLFLLGLFLHYDGQVERAGKFFRKAAALSPDESFHLRPFLRKPEGTDLPKAPAAGERKADERTATPPAADRIET